jgi:hypothetical protein
MEAGQKKEIIDKKDSNDKNEQLRRTQMNLTQDWEPEQGRNP